MEKYDGLDGMNKQRAIIIKEQRADLAKQHLWVLWTDYFKPEHLEAHPNLHDLFWRATKQAGACKKTVDPAEAKKLLELIDEIAKIFAATKAAV
jgi:nickel superoxide dismutase